jgi:hypothetical protein
MGLWKSPVARIPLPVPPNTIKLPGSGVKKRFIGLAGGMQAQGVEAMNGKGYTPGIPLVGPRLRNCDFAGGQSKNKATSWS